MRLHKNRQTKFSPASVCQHLLSINWDFKDDWSYYRCNILLESLRNLAFGNSIEQYHCRRWRKIHFSRSLTFPKANKLSVSLSLTQWASDKISKKLDVKIWIFISLNAQFFEKQRKEAVCCMLKVRYFCSWAYSIRNGAVKQEFDYLWIQ